ncbi:MAG: hypothetical protein C5B53_03190, partial [Candidatus Melainabacteria bacterium]
MREIRLPNGNGSNFESARELLNTGGNPQLALECWVPPVLAQQLEQHEVFCAFQQPENDNTARQLAGHIMQYCQRLFTSSTVVDNALRPPDQLPGHAQAAMNEIRRLLRGAADPERLFRDAMEIVNEIAGRTGRRYELTIARAPAPNQQTWIISGTYTQQREGVDRSLPVRIEIPPMVAGGDPPPNPIAPPVGANPARTFAEYMVTFATNERPGAGRTRSEQELITDAEDFREAWRRQPPGTREPGAAGQPPTLVDDINRWITEHNIRVNGRPVRMEFHRPFENGSEDYLQLVFTDERGGNASDRIYVGTSTWTQVLARRETNPHPTDPNTGGGFLERWLERAWGAIAPYVPYARWAPILIPWLFAEGYLPPERRALRNLLSGIGRRLGSGLRFGLVDAPLWVRNLLRRTPAPGGSTGQEFLEPTDLFSRSHLNDLTGTTVDARQTELETRLEALRRQFQDNPLLNNEVLTSFQADALQFADQLRDAQRNGTVTTSEQRARMFQDFMREWARNQGALTPEQRALFENVHISTDVHSFEGSALATASVVAGPGGARELHIVLPAALLSGNMSTLQINEALGSLYDACFRADALQRAGTESTNPNRLREIRVGGNLLAYYLEHSMDHTMHVGEQAHLARIQFNSSRAGLHTQHVSIEFRADGTMVVRAIGGAEMTAEQIRELEDHIISEELRHLDRRLEDQTLTQQERDRITERRRLVAELQARLADPARREEARRQLHEHLRARYDHHRARTGGSRVAWAMIITEALN